MCSPSFGARAEAARVMHAEEGQRLALAQVEAYRRELDALRRELARVVSLGDFGAANQPTMRTLPAVKAGGRRPTAA